jgi:tetratricopeptide (TPR) repeat protein
MLLWACVSLPTADPSDALFAAALRERGLDALLETYCRIRSAGEVNASLPAPLAMELALSLATRASRTADALERDRLWKEADDVLEQSLDKAGSRLERTRLEVQRVTIALAEAEWLDDWKEINGPHESSAELDAKLRRVIDLAEEARSGIADRLKDARDKPEFTEDAQTARQLTELLAWLDLRQGSAERLLALVDAEHRLPLLQRAIEHLQRVDDGSDVGRGLDARLLCINALRLAGRLPEAQALLDAPWPSDLTTDVALKLAVERVERCLAEGKILEALKLVHDERRRQAKLLPEWEYLYLKVLLHQSNQMKNAPDDMGALQASALRQLRVLDGLGQPLWVRRGESLLAQHAQHLLLRESTEYRHAAEILTRSGKHAEAAKIYRQASDQANAKGDVDNAAALLDEAARAWEKSGDYRLARDAFREAADAWPDRAVAPESLLRAVINARRAYLADPKPELYTHLHQIIDQHQRLYADHDTSAEIHLLEGSLRKAEHSYESAIESFLAVSASSRLASASRLAASRTYEIWKRPLAADAGPDGTLGQVIVFHERLLAPHPSASISFSVDERAEIAVRLARFLLDARVDRSADARVHLNNILSNQGLSHEWVERARGLELLALVRERRFEDAEKLADVHAHAPTDDVYASLLLLHEEADAAPELDRTFLGRVQARLVGQIHPQLAAMSDDRRTDWQLALARIELHLGNDEQLRGAIELLESLRSKHPRDARVIELLGLSYMRAQRHESAILLWRSMLRVLPEASPAWFRAKLQLMVSLRRSGQIKQARSVLGMLDVLHPDLGGAAMRERFEAERVALTETPSPRAFSPADQ